MMIELDPTSDHLLRWGGSLVGMDAAYRASYADPVTAFSAVDTRIQPEVGIRRPSAEYLLHFDGPYRRSPPPPIKVKRGVAPPVVLLGAGGVVRVGGG